VLFRSSKEDFLLGAAVQQQQQQPYRAGEHVVQEQDSGAIAHGGRSNSNMRDSICVLAESSLSDREDSSDDLAASRSPLSSLPSHTPLTLSDKTRQISNDSSGVDDAPIHQHRKSSTSKKTKSKSQGKSMPMEGQVAGKPISLAAHLSKKLSLNVNTSHADSDGGTSSGYCASAGSSGEEYEYIEDDTGQESPGGGKEERKTSHSKLEKIHKKQTFQDDVNQPHRNNSSANGTVNSSKLPQESIDVSKLHPPDVKISDDSARPVAPFTSEKLYLHNNLGADNFARAGKAGAAAIRKEALSVLNAPPVHSSNVLSVKFNGYNTSLKATRGLKKEKGNKRSKSANVVATGASKLVLPSLMSGSNNVHRSTPNGDQVVVVIPQLALRVIQSAPTVTRSLNLPPISKSKTPSNKTSKYKAGSFHGSSLNEVERGSNMENSFQKSIHFVSEEAEREGGILAPRKEEL